MENKDTKKLKVCAYVRVSTRSEYQKHSFDEQIEYWTTTLSSNPDYEFVKVYSDYGYSGKIGNRPAYRKMITDALNGKIDLIFCKSIARFGRDVVTLLSDIQKLRDKGIYVDFEIENINTSNTSHELYLTVYTAIAENELSAVSQSIKFGFKEKFKKGSCFCKPIFGYEVTKVDDDYDFTINPEQAETVRLIFELFLNGKTFTEIAKILNEKNILNKYGKPEWNGTMIPYILSNEKYTGSVYLQKYYTKNFKIKKNDLEAPAVNMFVIENHHELIVSMETYNLVKEKLDNRKKKPIKHKNKEFDFISSILYCGRCNSNYKRTIRKDYHGTEVTTYRCGKNRYKGECCHNSTIYPDTFKNLFIRAYNEFTKIKCIDTENCKRLNALIAMQESEIADFRKAHELNAFSFTIVELTMKPLLQELDRLQTELSQELGHIVNGRKIASKITIYNETIAEALLDKVLVEGNTLNYYFKNGVAICREFTNPTPGRQSKNKV